MKKIVIITSFAESHLLRHLIPNVIACLNPDKIIISEGLMKNGPENKKELDLDFRKKWCYPGTAAGFDWEDVVKISQKYPKLVDYGWNVYDTDSAIDSYKFSIGNCFNKDSMPVKGDVVICLEADSFLLESDSSVIEDSLLNLEIGTGLSVKYVDFLETQFYTECINIAQPKYRRFAYKFDDMQSYLSAMGDGFMSQTYHKLNKTDLFFVRHYNWWRPEPWKELRYELIWRKDPKYWQDFEDGLQKARKNSTIIALMEKKGIDIGGYCKDSVLFNKVLLRPSRQDEAKWAQFIDVEHPEAIKSHPNFVK